MGYGFDGLNRKITLTSGTIDVDVQDLWSRWMDWYLTSDNSKYLPAMRNVGGDPRSETENMGIAVFLLNDWRIVPQSANHRLTIRGDLFTDPSGFSPVDSVPGYTIVVEYSVSSLVTQIMTEGSGGGETDLTPVLEAISDLDGDVSDLHGDVIPIGVAVGDLHTDVGTLAGVVDDIHGDIGTLAGSVGDIHGDLETIHNLINSLVADIFATNIETGLTFKNSQRIALAMLAGIISGVTEGTADEWVEIKNAFANNKVRVRILADKVGNRKQIQFDLGD